MPFPVDSTELLMLQNLLAVGRQRELIDRQVNPSCDYKDTLSQLGDPEICSFQKSPANVVLRQVASGALMLPNSAGMINPFLSPTASQ